MAIANTPLVTLPREIKRNWGWLLVLGIVFVILGTIGLGMTIGLTLVSMVFFGVLLCIAGISQLLDVAHCTRWQGMVWHAVIAILYLLVGALVIYDPMLASTVITAMIAAVLIIIGVTRFLMAITLRHTQGWGWLLFAGIIAVLLGVLILMQWPLSGLWIIGLFIAIEMLVNGWTYIFMALALRKNA